MDEVLHTEIPRRDDASGPKEGRRDIGELELPLRYSVHASNHWNDGADRAEEMAEEHAERAPFFKEALATFKGLGAAVERPDRLDVVLVVEPDPIRDRITIHALMQGSIESSP